MSTETTLENRIKSLYIRSGYGRVLKSEIDALMFHYFLLEILGQKDFFLIDKKDIFDLSVKLKVSESKIKRLLEDEYILYYSDKNDEISAANLLHTIVSPLKFTRDDIKDGKIRLPVANPVVKKRLELAIYTAGGITDTSFNREILVISLYDFFRILKVEKGMDKIVNEELKLKLAEKNIGREEAEDLLKKKPPEILRDIAVGLGARLLGSDAAGDLLLSVLYRGVELFLGKT
jgi:hypothetical protein